MSNVLDIAVNTVTGSVSDALGLDVIADGIASAGNADLSGKQRVWGGTKATGVAVFDVAGGVIVKRVGGWAFRWARTLAKGRGAPTASLSAAEQGVARVVPEGAAAPTAEARGLLSSGSSVPNAGGFIKSFVQEADRIYYRVFTGHPQGSFLTAVRPSSAAWAREALALSPGNSAAFVQEVLVPAGTRLQRSRALSAFGHRGGGVQFELLDQIPSASFGPGVPLQ